MMSDYMRLLGTKLYANGYTVLPIIPGTKRPAIKAWEQRDITRSDVENWQSNGFGGYGVGIRTGGVVMFDIDAPTEVIADEIEGYLLLTLGAAPVRYGAYPKRGLLYRTEKPFSKITTREFDPPDREERHQSEVLGDGQQFVAFATHPDTKAPYKWMGKSPVNTPADKLTVITVEQAREAAARIEQIFLSHGLVPRSGRGVDVGPVDDDDLGSDPLSDVTLEALTKLVEQTPNEDVPYESTEVLAWLQMLMAIAHQTGKSEEGRALAYEWSSRSAKHDDAEFDKTWNSLEQKRQGRRPVTGRYIIKWAGLFEARQKPEIIVRQGHLDEIVDEAQRALSIAPIYRRGNRLVRPIVDEVDATWGRKTKVARLAQIESFNLLGWLSRAAIWKRFDKRAKKPMRIDPPGVIANMILAGDGEWPFPALKGVITTPTIRPDGSLLIEPGYDPATGLLLVSPPTLPAIPDEPTRDDAIRALRLLIRLLQEFPFIDEESRSVGLSILMTPVIRGAVPTAPMHVARAPASGTGKSYLIDVSSVIATGRLCPVIAAGHTQDETDKRLGAALLTGQPIVAIDNVNGQLGGDLLCQAISQTAPQIRILGTSDMPTIESRASIFATGNNIIIVGDLVRRTIRAALDANRERPDERHFTTDPIDTVLVDLGRFVAAILTIVKAYIVSGSPSQGLKPMVGFEAWSKLVRSALVWLDQADPRETQEMTRAEDPRRQMLRQFVFAWRDAIGFGEENALTTAEIINRAEMSLADGSDTNAARLYEALENIGGRSGNKILGSISIMAVAKWLSTYKDTVVEHYKIKNLWDKSRESNKWFLDDLWDL